MDQTAAPDRGTPGTADPLAKLSADLDPLLARVRELDLGESAVANAFDPNWGTRA